MVPVSALAISCIVNRGCRIGGNVDRWQGEARMVIVLYTMKCNKHKAF